MNREVEKVEKKEEKKIFGVKLIRLCGENSGLLSV
jgi:hypothetical protein